MFVAFVDNPRQRINIPTNVYMFNIYLQNTNVEFDTNEIASLRIKKKYSS